MKGLYRISLIVFACVACCLAACTHSEVDIPTYAEGHPATVKLNFNVDASPEITTRAAQDTYYEYLVENIYVFVFSNGNRVDLGKDFFTSTDINNYKNKEDAANNKQSSGTIEFEAISGSGLTIAAIANVGNSNTVLTQDDLSYDKIKTYADLQALAVSLDQQTVSRGRVFLMTGEVTADLKANETTTVTIPLKRTDSKITFNVTAATSNANIDDLEFIPGKWRVVNAPAKTWVLPREVSSLPLTEDLDAATVAGDFFTISETVAPQFEGKVNDAANSGTFTFYMPENLKAPKTQITDKDVPSFSTTYEGNPAYALREKQTKNTPTANDNVVTGQTYVNGDYVYAPKYGTYVVFTGELSYTDNSGDEPKYVIADVEYSVHLGHSGTDNVNDYNTQRNYHYTYNVTITGVNSLIVEVDNDQEERPGAEGDVVISASEIHNVDGHYDRALFDLTADEASKLLFSVSTPWERGVDDMAGTADLHDYKWIKFLINSEVDVADNQYAAFPGEQCYDGGKTEKGTAANSSVYGKAVTLRDIRQLSAYLSATKPTGNTVITAFIDEYLYFYNPTEDPLGESTTYKGVTQGTDATSLALWKQSVNQNDRLLHIIKAGDMKYSADGETSVSRSVVTFKQRPILTFYNVAADGLTTAWGTETINEIPRMPVTRSSYPSTQSNYVLTSQYNTAYNIVRVQTGGSSWRPPTYENQPVINKWADVISATEQYAMEDDYNDPSYACAIRNRDLNGDGEINTNEIQWYLAALDQLSDLWVGEPAMPAYAHLYDENNPDGYYNRYNRDDPATHIVSSTISGSSPWIYWAEEYGATSTHQNAIDWNQSPQVNGQHVVSIRCVRNLGIAYDDTTTLPQDYVQVSPTPGTNKKASTNNEYQVDLTYINPTALRTAADNGGALPYAKLNDVGENNRPYASFSVDPDYYGTNGRHTTTNWYRAYRGERGEVSAICPDGYRVPNQREMLIMIRTIDGWDYEPENGQRGYIMFNGQEFDDMTTNNFGAFYYYASDNRISRTLSTGKAGQTGVTSVVRCVKDNRVASPTPATPSSTYGTGGNLTGN